MPLCGTLKNDVGRRHTLLRFSSIVSIAVLVTLDTARISTEKAIMDRLISSRPVSYVRRASRAASYPLRGIWYFSRRREFWPLFLARLLPLSLISLVVYFILFAFTFLPQFAFLAIFHGWGAWVNAVVLVLGEGLIIIQGLFEGFFVDECRVDVFDVSLENWYMGA